MPDLTSLIFLLLSQLSSKPSQIEDGQASPTSVHSSTDPSSQLAPADGPAPTQEDVKVKVEVKKQEEEHDDGAETQAEGKGKMGKGQPDVKLEEKPEVIYWECVWKGSTFMK